MNIRKCISAMFPVLFYLIFFVIIMFIGFLLRGKREEVCS